MEYKRKSHSSNGSPAIIIPKVYLVSNHQTPIFVNHTSQRINGIATIVDDNKNIPKIC